MLAKVSKQEAAYGYWRACADIGLAPSVDLVSVLVAHGALETGNFSVGLFNGNVGNVKAGPSYVGKYTCITLNEILRNPKTGKNEEYWFAPEGPLTKHPKHGGVLKYAPMPVPPGHPQTRMRAYDTLDDGIEDKIRFMLQPAYSNALDHARRGDAGSYVRSIRARHYFTAYADIPLNQVTPYETSVVSLARAYRPFVEQARSLAKVEVLPRPVPTITDADRARNEAMRFDTHSLLYGYDGANNDDPKDVA